MDYSFFDSLLDSVLVIGEDREVVYANQVAATLCDSSVRRMTKGKRIYEFLEFEDQDLFLTPNGTKGRDEPLPIVEVAFKKKSGEAGKVQLVIQPFVDIVGRKQWVVIMRDVTLEEVLHGKYRAELEQKEEVIVQLKKAQRELEDYSKNLERMVEERTAEIKQANRMLSAIMNSLGQGFLVFDENGLCSNIYTKACEDVLESNPSGQTIFRVLNLSSADEEQFKSWMKAIFNEALPFDSLKDLGPSLYQHSKGKYITLNYFAIRSEDERIANLVLVATDKTSEHEANLALERERQHAKMILKMVSNKKQFAYFLESANRTIEKVGSLIPSDSGKSFDANEAFRCLHTLEGEAGAFSVVSVRHAARVAQEIIEPIKNGGEATPEILGNFRESLQFLREKFDEFLNENRNLLAALRINEERTFELSFSEVQNLLRLMKSSGVRSDLITQFEEAVFKQPLSDFLHRFADVAALVAEKQGKSLLPMEFFGTHLKVYPESYEGLFSALVHVFRNAVDHGIEPAEERELAGKNPAGKIEVDVTSCQVNGQAGWQLVVRDDGKGISPSLIRRKLAERKPDLNTDGLSDHEVIQFIFDAGFSSRDQIGEFSGRGVGMDAVKTEVERLGGKVWVDSVEGSGTTVTLQVPDLPLVASVRKSA